MSAMLRRLILSCVLAATAATAAIHAESLRIIPIADADTVVVTFELTDAYTDEVRQAISSGLRTTFTYNIDLRMVVPSWVDRTVASAVVSISDQYDNLTRRHSLSRTVDGRVMEAVVTDDSTVVRQWLTTLTRLPLIETAKLDPNRDYYVRISARARPRGGSIIGWANAVVGQAKFTFIP
jgi:Domain of unknown function (DUF4390)